MASLSKNYGVEKLQGKIYTPRFVVDKILDDIGFDNSDVLGKTILDASCGDGRFLVEVARRIIKFSQVEDLQENLSKIHGWDIDAQAINSCKSKLNNLIVDFDFKIEWNIKLLDALSKIENSLFVQQSETFDFIVGNPPYIRIQHLHENQRAFIQQNFDFCQNGSTDIFIAFYELSWNLLAENGLCGLITPNTFFCTETAKRMRDFFVQRKVIRQITNYADIQIFDNATTYSAIFVFGKSQQNDFVYQHAKNKNEFSSRKMRFEELNKQKFWNFSTNQPSTTNARKLKDICRIHVGVTTLCDKAYIFEVEDLDEKFVMANTKLRGNIKIEREILKPIIKASRLKSDNEAIRQWILFPYEKQNGKHKIIDELLLKESFPFAYNYLLSVKDFLDKRDNGKPNPVSWFAFGRSQGLETSFGKKILFSPMNKTPRFILSQHEHCTFYSGYCIKYDGNYELLLNQLNSEKLREFIMFSSRDFRGGWKAYNKKILEEFAVENDRIR